MTCVRHGITSVGWLTYCMLNLLTYSYSWSSLLGRYKNGEVPNCKTKPGFGRALQAYIMTEVLQWIPINQILIGELIELILASLQLFNLPSNDQLSELTRDNHARTYSLIVSSDGV